MVHVIFDVNSINIEDFLNQQCGSGQFFEGIPFQRGYGHYQKGAGFGSIFRSLLRFLVPLAKKAGKVLTEEGISTGARILNDLQSGSALKDALIEEGKKGVKNLAHRAANKFQQQGSGRKRKRVSSSVKKLVGRSVPRKAVNRKRRRVDSLGFY